MREKICYIYVLLLVALTSCIDRPIIIVSGKITEESTSKPIANAEVVVLCWYKSSPNDASFKKQTLFTDKDGNYRVVFNRGFKVCVASKHTGFVASRSYNQLTGNRIKVDLQLSRAKQNSTLIDYLNINNSHFDTSDVEPFMRIRFYSIGSGATLDLSKSETYGVDLMRQRTNPDTLGCDVWFKPINVDEQLNSLVANHGGGILPVFAKDIKSSFMYEKTEAPATGYLKEYRLTGKEAGFFVLCRDGKTYGKLIFEQSEISSGGSDAKLGYFKELGKNFNVLYQPDETTNLAYSNPEIDLENFLVDHRLR